MDADGSSNPEDVTGDANGATYTLVEDDHNKRLRATVSFTDDRGHEEELSALSGLIGTEDDVDAVGLEMSGTAKVDSTLTAVTGGITDENGLTNAEFTFQWTRVSDDGTSEDIVGATSQTYTLVKDDQGTQVRVTVSFMDDRKNIEMLISRLSGEVVRRGQCPPPQVP